MFGNRYIFLAHMNALGYEYTMGYVMQWAAGCKRLQGLFITGVARGRLRFQITGPKVPLARWAVDSMFCKNTSISALEVCIF